MAEEDPLGLCPPSMIKYYLNEINRLYAKLERVNDEIVARQKLNSVLLVAIEQANELYAKLYTGVSLRNEIVSYGNMIALTCSPFSDPGGMRV